MRDGGLQYGGVYEGATVLVTGGAGFIGSHLARALAGLGARVRVLDDLSTGRAANLEGTDVDLRVGSILDEGALRSAVDGATTIFHEAAMVSVPQSVEAPDACCSINVAGTERVLEAARALGAERLVFASSAAVYGDAPRLPSRETDPVVCCSPYAASKAAGEALVAAYGRCYPLRTVSLRYFNIFGPRQDPNSPYAAAMAAFIDAFRHDRPPVVYGDGTQTRDFTAVDNVVHANLLAGAMPEDPGGAVVNIGTGTARSLLELIAGLQALFDEGLEPVFEPPRPGDVMHSCPDVARAHAVLGYEPIVDFERGLGATIVA
jgi:UDP-glucose 4-epimerase